MLLIVFRWQKMIFLYECETSSWKPEWVP
jgi:hypothetical protein